MKYNVEMTNGDMWETDFQDAGAIPAVGALYFARLLYSEGRNLNGVSTTMAVCFVSANIAVIFESDPREPTDGS